MRKRLEAKNRAIAAAEENRVHELAGKGKVDEETEDADFEDPQSGNE